ncbi:MAG: CBS domain-containing protein, partial [Myxococcaceae bacterium]
MLSENMHTRLPVYEGTIDNVVGYVSVKDVLFFAWDQKLFVLRDLLRKPFFVPEVKKAVDLLEEMRSRRLHIDILVEEQGGMAFIVTMEVLVVELV